MSNRGRNKNIFHFRNRVWPVRKADNLTAICGPILRQCSDLNISKPYSPKRSVMIIEVVPFEEPNRVVEVFKQKVML
jgi:hypothetical protein